MSLLGDLPTPEWLADAACRGLDPELFFPSRGQDTSQALAVCRACPVRFECLEAALDRGEKFGIWGGMSERQRRRLRRTRHAARQPEPPPKVVNIDTERDAEWLRIELGRLA